MNFPLLYNNVDCLTSNSMEMWSEGCSQLATQGESYLLSLTVCSDTTGLKCN